MKNFFYVIVLALMCTACTSTKKSMATAHPAATPSAADPVFLDNITVRPSGASSPSVSSHVAVKEKTNVVSAVFSSDIERCSDLQFKYAILLDEQVEKLNNEKLISFLEEWDGVPYKYGGSAKTGIDCSAFSSEMMSAVYRIAIPRTCNEQYRTGKKIGKSQLSQGDLVFFNTSGGISHVGVYLGHEKFVHASTSSGVMISDLDESYFKRRYVGSARIR